MNDRMKKDELISLIESLEIDNNEFWILSSSALVLRGLFPDAGDLDLAVTKKGLEQLKEKYNLKQKENGWYIVNEKTECVLDTKEPYKVERYGNYNLESLEKYFDFLKNSSREKDKIKYNIVRQELDKRKNMEYLDLYDENRNLTGEKVLRSKDMVPTLGKYISIVIVFIENSEGKFLIQKTSKEKGSVFATTGGLVKSGSTPDDTIVTEIKEELGINIDINELKLVKTIKRGFAFQDTYYLKKDIDINELTLQKEEVEYVEWLSVDEINNLIKNEEFRKGNVEPFKYITNNISRDFK